MTHTSNDSPTVAAFLRGQRSSSFTFPSRCRLQPCHSGCQSTEALDLYARVHLQRMPHLRNLRTSVCVYGTSLSVSLVEQSCFRFIGQCAQAGLFVAIGHTLQELHISSRSFHFPWLSMFIRDAEIPFFFAARLATFGTHLTTSMFSCPHSIDDQPRPNNVLSIKTPFDAPLSSALSAMLGTLEDIILSCPNPSRLEYHCLEMSLGPNSLKSSAT
jgi:hypothetical protein